LDGDWPAGGPAGGGGVAVTNPTIEQRRQAYLDWLYERYGRTDGLYTGLYRRRIRELVQRDMDEALGPLGDWS
jgi:hypothetical protein